MSIAGDVAEADDAMAELYGGCDGGALTTGGSSIDGSGIGSALSANENGKGSGGCSDKAWAIQQALIVATTATKMASSASDLALAVVDVLTAKIEAPSNREVQKLLGQLVTRDIVSKLQAAGVSEKEHQAAVGTTTTVSASFARATLDGL
jgi:hypothetical protein